MAQNPLSNMSYTNKDFSSIYIELLDLVKKLTYRWDPSISNESDPGVILLKLDAIIGDKNDYNIDKNILEAFPETLTQNVSARSIYKQLAYKMPWYQSAITNVTFNWLQDNESATLTGNQSVTIPKFTMITDSNKEFVYTTLDEVIFKPDNLTYSVKCIEGTINDFTINSDTTITLLNLDYQNRLYFQETNIAENGIFIYNNDDINGNSWRQVDNLYIEPLGNKYYEFGVDPRTNLVYIQFPSDIGSLIGQGLNIKYITSSGSRGNIISQTLDRFYQDVSVSISNSDAASINLTTDIIRLTNVNGTSNGSDPQELADAYTSYMKTAGTFKTLVTLRDYMNALYTSGLISNSVVCDRTNDIQCTYSVIVNDDDVNPVTHIVNGGVTAYDLKLYLLHKPTTMITLQDYKDSFNIIPDNDKDGLISREKNDVLLYIDSLKSVQHDFKDIEATVGTGISTFPPFMFRNYFPLNIKIIPQSPLTQIQINEVKQNINKSLFTILNSSKLEFGVEANYDKIYDTIVNCDSRIKTVILDDFQYTTFAVYWDSDAKEFKEIPISHNNSSFIREFNPDGVDVNSYINTNLKPSMDDYIYKNTYFINTNDKKIYKYNTTSKNVQEYSTLDLQKSIQTDIIVKSILAGTTPLYSPQNYFNYTIKQNIIGNEIVEADRITTSLTITPYGKDNILTTQSATYTLEDNESIRCVAPSLLDKVSYGNYTKYDFIGSTRSLTNTLTTLYNLTYTQYQKNISYYGNLTDYRVTSVNGSQTHITGKKLSTYISENNGFINSWSDTTNSTSVYITDATQYILANNSYMLKDDEYLIFYWRSEDSDDAPYNWRKYGKGTIFTPTFNIQASIYGTNKPPIISPDKFVGTEGKIYYSNDPTSQFQLINNSYSGNVTLSGTKTITINTLNQVTSITNSDISKTTNMSYYYFITNNVNSDDQYVLQPNSDDGTYILENDEYFIYLDKLRTSFEIVGAGTLLKFSTIENDTETPYTTALTVNKVSYSDIVINGIDVFKDKCKNKGDLQITLTEQQIYSFSGGDEVTFSVDPLVLNDKQSLSTNEQSDWFKPTSDYGTGEDNQRECYTKPNDIIVVGCDTYFEFTNDTNETIITPYYPVGTSGNFDRTYTYRYNDKTVNCKTTIKTLYGTLATKPTYDIRTAQNNYSIVFKGQNNKNLFLEMWSKFFTRDDQDGNISFTANTNSSVLLNIDGNVGFYKLYVPTIEGGADITETTPASYIQYFQQPTDSYNPPTTNGFNSTNYDDNTTEIKCGALYLIADNNNTYQKFELTSDTYKALDGYKLSYKASDGTTGELKNMDLGDDILSWKLKSVLNINCSYDLAQKIIPKDDYHEQHITYSKSSNSSIELPYNNNISYLMSSVSINKVGGTNIDISYLSLNGDTMSPKLYAYTLNDYFKENAENNTQVIDNITQNTVEVLLTSQAVEFNNLPVLNGIKRLLVIKNVSPDKPMIVKGTTGTSWSSLNCLNATNSDTGLGYGTYYFNLEDNKMNNITSIQISGSGSGFKDTDKVVIYPLYFYSEFKFSDDGKTRSERYGISTTDLETKIKSLNIRNNFNYIYEIPEEDFIEDPLKPISYFNDNHICNEFTLPIGELYMSSKVSSNITIVNNR